jgi:putative adhesin
MTIRLPDVRYKIWIARATLALAAFSILSFSTALDTFAQRSFSKTYPARRNVRLTLRNWAGAIIVKTWGRSEIKISAQMESPAARFIPEMSDTGLKVDVVSATRGRGNVGAVNFTIQVPANSTVDLETQRGNITVSGVQGLMVRAHAMEGDIELTDIRAAVVSADNITGDILFDGELLSGGTYDFQSIQGNINIRVPDDSAFRLVATAPLTRNIALGIFANGGGLSFISDGRKVVGNVGDGRASLNILNQRGAISFLRR